jgi:hypothetical protein
MSREHAGSNQDPGAGASCGGSRGPADRWIGSRRVGARRQSSRRASSEQCALLVHPLPQVSARVRRYRRARMALEPPRRVFASVFCENL